MGVSALAVWLGHETAADCFASFIVLTVAVLSVRRGKKVIYAMGLSVCPKQAYCPCNGERAASESKRQWQESYEINVSNAGRAWKE